MIKNDWLKEEYFAHRGYHTLKEKIPENSLLAFQRAIDYGYAIECDIRLTKDHQVVVFHDANLYRMCGVDQMIEHSLFDEINEYCLLDSNEKIPLLNDLLKLVSGKVPLLIELKTNRNAKTISRALEKEMKDYTGLYAIQSFDPSVILWYKRNQPTVLRGQIAQLDNEKKNRWLIRYMADRMILNIITKPHFINYKISDMPLKILDVLHKKGIPILAYTAKSQEDFDFVVKHYDNAMFEGFHPKK
ncbi:MAG: glycerophosphodiester phosphodiesterase family protein [Candidatus Izemoplasmataceae bacterium]